MCSNFERNALPQSISCVNNGPHSKSPNSPYIHLSMGSNSLELLKHRKYDDFVGSIVLLFEILSGGVISFPNEPIQESSIQTCRSNILFSIGDPSKLEGIFNTMCQYFIGNITESELTRKITSL